MEINKSALSHYRGCKRGTKLKPLVVGASAHGGNKIFYGGF